MVKDFDIWEDLGIAEHRDEALKWAEDAFPQFLGNETLVAQLYFTNVMEKELPAPVDIITVGDLLEKFKKFEPTVKADGKKTKLWAVIEVLMVQMLDDSRGYFGCPKCFNKVDRGVGVCANPEHPGEEPKGVRLTFQKWQAGDNTGNLIVSFGPGNHQQPNETMNYTLTLRGYMNNFDGGFSVWEVINKKAPKRLRKLTSLKKKERKMPVLEEPEEEDIDEAAVEEAIFGENEETETEDDVDIARKDALFRSVRKMLNKHYKDKPNKAEHLVNWIVVQPQFRKWPKGEERNAVAMDFLKELEQAGLFSYTDESKEQIIYTPEE